MKQIEYTIMTKARKIPSESERSDKQQVAKRSVKF